MYLILKRSKATKGLKINKKILEISPKQLIETFKNLVSQEQHMDDKDTQKVRLKGPLWTTKCVVGIIKDILIIIVMIVLLIAMIVLVPKIIDKMNSLKEFQNTLSQNLGGEKANAMIGQNKDNNYYPNNNYQNSPDNSGLIANNGLDQGIKELFKQANNFAQSEKWTDATSQLTFIRTKISQSQSNYQTLMNQISQLEQAIKKQDKDSFNTISQSIMNS